MYMYCFILDLHIERMCLTNGASPLDYLEAYNIDLFLSSYEDEVEQALSKGRKCEKAMYVFMCVCVCMYVEHCNKR